MRLMTEQAAVLIVGMQGTIAQQPAATDLPDGFRYIQTDGVEQYVASGAWEDVPTTGGGGGGITTITSTDSSLNVTDPTGPSTDLSVQDSPAWAGVTITGTPSAGDVPTAATSTTATWEAPTGGLPTGWTEDASNPANVTTNGGNLDLGTSGNITLASGQITNDDGSNQGYVQPGQVGAESRTTAEQYFMGVSVGVGSTPPAGVPAFSAVDGALGATVAFDGGGLTVENAPLGASIAIVTVQTGAPSTYETQLVYDNTAVTGGLYGWDGSAYQKIGGLV